MAPRDGPDMGPLSAPLLPISSLSLVCMVREWSRMVSLYVLFCTGMVTFRSLNRLLIILTHPVFIKYFKPYLPNLAPFRP